MARIGEGWRKAPANACLDLARRRNFIRLLGPTLVAQRYPLTEARRAREVLGKGGVIGRIVLVPEQALRPAI
jgi:hypothetical protein